MDWTLDNREKSTAHLAAAKQLGMPQTDCRDRRRALLALVNSCATDQRTAESEGLSLALAFYDVRKIAEAVVKWASRRRPVEAAEPDTEDKLFGQEVRVGEVNWISSHMKARTNGSRI
jgi:hypothetical protein